MLNIVLVNPKQFDNKTFYINLGLATIGAIVRNAGHVVSVIDFDELKYKRKRFSEKVYHGSGKLKDVNVLLVSGMITNLKNIIHAIQVIKKRNHACIVVLGGGAASVLSPFVINELEGVIDFFVVNEGDDVILPLLGYIESNLLRFGVNIDLWHSLDVANVKAIQRNKYTGVVKHSPPDISNVPMPCYDLFDTQSYLDYLRVSGRAWELYSSRGCPMNCSFCYRIAGSKVRYRNIENVLSEMDYLHTTYGVTKFSFEDDSFGLDKKWLQIFCDKLRHRPYKFRIQAGINSMAKVDHLIMMKAAGLFGISMGIESGSEKILSVLKKKNNLNVASRIISYCNENDIHISATFILGAYSESKETIEATINFLCNNHLSNYQILFLNPYPGTELYQNLLDSGVVKDGLDALLKISCQDSMYINLTDFSNHELFSMREYIHDSVSKYWNEKKVNPCTWKRNL